MARTVRATEKEKRLKMRMPKSYRRWMMSSSDEEKVESEVAKAVKRNTKDLIKESNGKRAYFMKKTI